MNKEAIINNNIETVVYEDDSKVVCKNEFGTYMDYERVDNDLFLFGEKVGAIYPLGTDVEAILQDMKMNRVVDKFIEDNQELMEDLSD